LLADGFKLAPEFVAIGLVRLDLEPLHNLFFGFAQVVQRLLCNWLGEYQTGSAVRLDVS
jgi:hypothetical protein